MVDRKTVLTNLKNFYEWNFKNYPLNFDEAQVIIEALEQKPVIHGKWTRDGWDREICSACKKPNGWITSSYKFCPNCGADMRGDNND